MIKQLRIGTDCSGIEAPIQALIQMKINYKHVFSSEINKFAIQSIRANYNPETLYQDMTIPRDLEPIDVYVCGFPCQPFSNSGLRLGHKDMRGNIFFNCVEVIQQTRPSIFILENVKGILSADNGNYIKKIRKCMDELSNYSVYYWVLNTKDYGIPQNRERLYIIGLDKSKTSHEINKPQKTICRPIESYIDRTCSETEVYTKMYEARKHIFETGTFVDVSNIRPECKSKKKPEYSTCITSFPIWNVPMHRKATIKECLSLQGFPIDFIQVVSDAQMRKQIGNSMSVNVLIEIFKECFKTIEF